MAKKSATDDARVVLAVGKESVLVQRVIDGVIHSARATDPQTVRTDISADSDSAVGEFAVAMSPSLFGETNVVVVSGIDGTTDELNPVLLDAVANVPDHVRLVLLHPGGVKGKKLLDGIRKTGALEASCGELKGKDLEAALTAEFRKHGKKPTADAITQLQHALGSNLSELLAAISQLCSDSEADIIDGQIVAGFYEGVADVKGWNVSDALWNAKPVEVLEQFRWAVHQDNSASVPMIIAMSNGLRTLLKYAAAPAGMSEGDLASMLGVPPWRIKYLRAQKAKWNPEQLAMATKLLALADRASKGTTYDPAVNGGVSLESAQSMYEIEKNLLAVRPPRD